VFPDLLKPKPSAFSGISALFLRPAHAATATAPIRSESSAAGKARDEERTEGVRALPCKGHARIVMRPFMSQSDRHSEGAAMKLKKDLLAAVLAGTAAGVLRAEPYVPALSAPQAHDLGDCAAVEANVPITLTIALTPRNTRQRDQLIESIYQPGSFLYQHFLTPGQFKRSFGPDSSSVGAVTHELEAQGFKVTQAATGLLRVSGTAQQIETAFGVQLHTFEVPATPANASYRYRAPMAAPRLSPTMAGSVRAVLGLDTRAHLTPHLQHPQWQSAPRAPSPNTVDTADPPGSWTVLDYAKYYDVNPLYHEGLSGRGQTLAILTFASFTPSDAYRYWSALGLKVNSKRITEVPVDGGSGPPSDAAGSDETTLDVEQSGGLAPGANILVYEGPNTNQGFVDVFAAAIDSNQADTISISWGEWEGFDGTNILIGSGDVSSPTSGEHTSILMALDDLLAQAALQGQSVFASAGDYGAYDASNSLPLAPSPQEPYSFNPVLSVDDPAIQRYITAAGGTTLPGSQVYSGPAGQAITIEVAQEQAWSWQYLAPLCSAFGQNPQQCSYFPAGAGGGVSIYMPRPFYQSGISAVASTVPGQTLAELTPPPPQGLYELPATFAGRNVPDLSSNADPQTGYVIYYTSSAAGFGIYPAGGTSFVSPELSGVTALFVEYLGHRLGLLNPALYKIARFRYAYEGHHAPYRDITAGDNWYWRAGPGYDRASGIGVPDVANLLAALRSLEQ
jgi:kumamolisin